MENKSTLHNSNYLGSYLPLNLKGVYSEVYLRKRYWKA